jgi:hypothetical protein
MMQNKVDLKCEKKRLQIRPQSVECFLKIFEFVKNPSKNVTGLTQLSQAMAREACRGPKNHTVDIETSGGFSCSIR